METVTVNQRKTKSQCDKLSMEDYLLLLQSRSHLHLHCSHLNQIISMHGYKKLHRFPKKLLSQAVSTLELVDPSRSTLGDYISPTVNTSLEDVVADLKDLDWQECSLTSIKTLSSNDAVERGSKKKNTAAENFNGVVSARCSVATTFQAQELAASKTSRTCESADPVKKAEAKRQKIKSEGETGGGAAALALDCVPFFS